MSPTPVDFTLRTFIKAERQTYYRLIALWVVCEAFLGGIIHGLRLPVSGLLIGSCSVICICLIAWCNPDKGAILKATVVVAVFKMMLSPQSPFPAYIAVLFQGLMGELLFLNRKYFRTACLLLGVTALLESGIQRIIVLTVLYGTGFWDAVNEFIQGITHEKTITPYSQYLAAGYVVLHLIAGAVVGGFAGTLPKKVSRWRKELGHDVVITDNALWPGKGSQTQGLQKELPKAGRKNKRRKTGLLISWILLLLLYVQSEFAIGEPLLSSHLVVRMLVRSILIVLTWYFLVAPLLMKGLTSWLEKQKVKSQTIVNEISVLLPSMRELVAKSWLRTQGKNGLKRIPEFGKRVLVLALTTSDNLYILTGPVQTGKTTRLREWAKDRTDVFGILSPVIGGKRFFLDLKTKQTFPMEAAAGESAVAVGKYRFSAGAFQRAKSILNAASGEKEGWIVVDEIGPLELDGKGFSDDIHAMLRNRSEQQKLIFVIREGILERAVKHFGLEGSYNLVG
jgi:nucleoside-triphosphatase THEP1/ABC-type thiamin/hydroxymethylpyrimidine transport system permease subunit